jgi:preprotein translocase subunit SecG
MKILLIIFMFAALCGGSLIIMDAKSAIHEILAWVMFLQATLFFCTIAVLEVMDKHAKARAEQAENNYNAILALARRLGRKEE